MGYYEIMKNCVFTHVTSICKRKAEHVNRNERSHKMQTLLSAKNVTKVLILIFIHRERVASFLTLSYQTQTYTSLVGALQYDGQDTSTTLFHM